MDFKNTGTNKYVAGTMMPSEGQNLWWFLFGLEKTLNCYNSTAVTYRPNLYINALDSLYILIG